MQLHPPGLVGAPIVAMRLLNESGERAQEHQEWRAKGEADVEAALNLQRLGLVGGLAIPLLAFCAAAMLGTGGPALAVLIPYFLGVAVELGTVDLLRRLLAHAPLPRLALRRVALKSE